MLEIREMSVNSPQALELLDELNAALSRITGSSGASGFQPEQMDEKRSVFLIAFEDEYPMACGAIRPQSERAAELKRVYARPNRAGIAHRLVAALEECARRFGYDEIRLETRRVNQHAVAFYQSCGYAPCPNYGRYIGRDEAVCFAKSLQRKNP